MNKSNIEVMRYTSQENRMILHRESDRVMRELDAGMITILEMHRRLNSAEADYFKRRVNEYPDDEERPPSPEALPAVTFTDVQRIVDAALLDFRKEAATIREDGDKALAEWTRRLEIVEAAHKATLDMQAKATENGDRVSSMEARLASLLMLLSAPGSANTQKLAAEGSAALTKQITTLSERLAEYERQPRINRYRGIWDAQTQYEPGDFCTQKGGVWCATVKVIGARPCDSPALFKLAVKRGNDGKDAGK